jgi:hypothetical protein
MEDSRALTDLIEIFPHLPLHEIRAAFARHKTVECTVSFLLLESPSSSCNAASKDSSLANVQPKVGRTRPGIAAGSSTMTTLPVTARPLRVSDSIDPTSSRPKVVDSNSVGASTKSHATSILTAVEESTAMLQGLFPEMPLKAVEFALRSRAGCCEGAAAYSECCLVYRRFGIFVLLRTPSCEM